MRIFILSLIFSGLCLSSIAQVISAEKSSMKKKESYIRQASEVTGKRIVFTEIEINATPKVVRAIFLDFDKWPEWNQVIPEIAVKSGDIDNLETKPTLDLTLDFGPKGDPAKAPVNPDVLDNN